MTTITISTLLRESWGTFTKRPLMLMGIVLVLFIISGFSSYLTSLGDKSGMMLPQLVLSIFDVVVQLFLGIGIIHSMLKADTALENLELKDLWYPSPFWQYLFASILTGVVVTIGFVLLIIPGVIAALALFLVPYLVIDKGYPALKAFRESIRLTKGHRIKLLALILLVVALNVLGALALGIGLLVSVPVSLLMVVRAYRMLSEEGGQEEAMVAHG